VKKMLVVLMTALCLTTLCLATFGCTDKAEELYETAKLEELQNNPTHARKLYREILEDHPRSDYADKAKERLSALGDD